MAGTSQFVFPLLKNGDIVLCLQELGVPFAEEDLAKPTPQRMQMVYEAFADILMGYTRETFEANVRACAAEIDNFVHTTNPRQLVLHQTYDDLGHLPGLDRTHDFPQTIVTPRAAVFGC
jgi:kinetochore protein Nuf2